MNSEEAKQMDLVEKPPVIIYTQNQKKRLRKKKRKEKEAEASREKEKQEASGDKEAAEAESSSQPMTNSQILEEFDSCVKMIRETEDELSDHERRRVHVAEIVMRYTLARAFYMSRTQNDSSQLEHQGTKEKPSSGDKEAEAEASIQPMTNSLLLEKFYSCVKMIRETEDELSDHGLRLVHVAETVISNAYSYNKSQLEHKGTSEEAEASRKKEKQSSGDKEAEASSQPMTNSQILEEFDSCVKMIRETEEELSDNERRLVHVAEIVMRYSLAQVFYMSRTQNDSYDE